MARYLAVFGGGFVPDCKPDGTFEEIQCYDNTCWCVDKNGVETGSTRVALPNRPDCKCKLFIELQ